MRNRGPSFFPFTLFAFNFWITNNAVAACSVTSLWEPVITIMERPSLICELLQNNQRLVTKMLNKWKKLLYLSSVFVWIPALLNLDNLSHLHDAFKDNWRSLHACCMFLHVCCMFLHVCYIYLHACYIFLHACYIYLHACYIYLHACCIFLHACYIYLHACYIFLHACYIFCMHVAYFCMHVTYFACMLHIFACMLHIFACMLHIFCMHVAYFACMLHMHSNWCIK